MSNRWILGVAVVLGAAACGHDGSPTPAPKNAPTAVTPPPPPPAPSLPAAFTDSLRRAGMTFTMPDGFTPVPTVDNPQWKYDFAMRSADGTVEVRIRVDPLDEALAEAAKCKQDPSCHGTDPNQRGATWLMVVAADIGGGAGLPAVHALPADAMKTDYGADSGAVAEVVPGAEMKTEHHQALVFLIHKADHADAVFAVLHDGLRKDQLPGVLQGLRFP